MDFVKWPKFSSFRSLNLSLNLSRFHFFQSRFRLLLYARSSSNFACAFFRPFPGDNFFVFLNFEKMTEFWHFESSLRFENFWSFVSYISCWPNGFKFCIRLLQTIPWGTFVFVCLNFEKNGRVMAFWKLLKVWKFLKLRFIYFLLTKWIQILHTSSSDNSPGTIFWFLGISKKWPATYGILKAP